jgi:hypothetical protein
VVPDRLGLAWENFRTLPARDQRAFVEMLRQWHLARRIEAVAARGGNYGYRSPLAGLSLGAALDADDLKNI